jgi:Concanavalin A-like lectin/glucanases superfamily
MGGNPNMKILRLFLFFLVAALAVPLSGAIASGVDYAAVVNGAGPAGYWRLGEAPGAPTAIDASGHGLLGQYRNVQTGSPGAVLSESDTAAQFAAFSDTANNDEVYVGPSGDLGASGTPFTVELWASTSVISGDRALIGSSLDGIVPDWWVAVTDDAGFEGRVRTLIVSGGVSKVHYGPDIRIDDGVWHHIVATLDRGGVSEVYVDGVASGNGDVIQPVPVPSFPSPPDSTGLTIGDIADYPQFVGRIDEVAVYPTPLTSAQVSAHLEAGDFSLPVDYTYAEAVSAGLEVPPTASEAGLPVCPVDNSGFDGYATPEEAEAAGDEATLQANDEPECVPDRSETVVTVGGVPRHYAYPGCVIDDARCGYHFHGVETQGNQWQGMRIHVEVTDPDVDHYGEEFDEEFVVNRALVKHDRVSLRQNKLEIGWEESQSQPDPNRRYVYTEWETKDDPRPRHSRHSQYPLGTGRFISVRLRKCHAGTRMCADILWRRCIPQCRNRWEFLDRNTEMECSFSCFFEQYTEVFSMQANSPHPALNASDGKLDWRNTKLRVAPNDWRRWTDDLGWGLRLETPPNLSPYNSCWLPTPPYDTFHSFYTRKGVCL